MLINKINLNKHQFCLTALGMCFAAELNTDTPTLNHIWYIQEVNNTESHLIKLFNFDMLIAM